MAGDGRDGRKGRCVGADGLRGWLDEEEDSSYRDVMSTCMAIRLDKRFRKMTQGIRKSGREDRGWITELRVKRSGENEARPKMKEREVEQGSDKRKESNKVERGIRSEDVA